MCLSHCGLQVIDVRPSGASFLPYQAPPIPIFLLRNRTDVEKSFVDECRTKRDQGFYCTSSCCWHSHYRRDGFNILGQKGILDDWDKKSRVFLTWAGREEVTSLLAHLPSWFTAGHNEWHILARYIRAVQDVPKCFMIDNYFEAPFPCSSCQEKHTLFPRIP